MENRFLPKQRSLPYCLLIQILFVLALAPASGQVSKGPSRYKVELELDHFMVHHVADYGDEQHCFGFIGVSNARTGAKKNSSTIPNENTYGVELWNLDRALATTSGLMVKGKKNVRVGLDNIKRFTLFEGLTKEEAKDIEFEINVMMLEMDYSLTDDAFLCANCERAGSSYDIRDVRLSWPSVSRSIDAISRGDTKAVTIGNDKYLDLNMMVDPSDPKKGYTQVRFQIFVTRS